MKLERNRITLLSGGRRRSAVLYAPAAAPGGPLPLVLTLHGSGSGAAEQMTLSGLEDLADRHGVAVVAPEGAIRVAGGFAWNVPHVTDVAGAPDDERFLLDVIDAVVAAGVADPGRVYATGLSGGGRMVSQLAADHPDRLAGIAPVAGLRAGAPLASDPRVPDPATFPVGRSRHRPVPVISFHGTQDPVNPFDGGGAPYWGYPVLTALERWAQANGCAPEPVEEHLTEHVSSLAYAPAGAGGRGAGRATAVLYVVEGGGHTWPGSAYPFPADLGHVTDEVGATEVMWAFFAALDPLT